MIRLASDIENNNDMIQPSSTVTIVDRLVDQKSSITNIISDSGSNNSREPYSIFTKRQKFVIVLICATSCFFSPFSTNIYFPSLLTIQQDLQVTEQLVSLTVTMYMIVQGIAPAFWGAIADTWGRRPVYISTFFIYILSSLGLGFTRNYATLLSLRMLQAFGSSSGVAVGAGSIGDIAAPLERGGYMGVYCLGAMIGPMIGPVIGGAISHQLGWRWIFWVLAIAAFPLWLAQIFVLPETLRKLVGNGSGYANPTPLQYWRNRRDKKEDVENSEGGSTAVMDCMVIPGDMTEKIPKDIQENMHVSKKKSFPNPLNSLRYLKEKDVALISLYYSLQYTGLYCILTSLTDLFTDIYKLNDLQVGLCFISNGFGSAVGSFTSGRILNWRFKQMSKSLNIDEQENKRGSLDPNFPIEQARMGITWIWGIVFNVAMIGYGWCLFYKVHVAVPIAINFILSYCSASTFNSVHTLMVDLYPKNSAAIMASNNITRLVPSSFAENSVKILTPYYRSIFSATIILTCAPGISSIGAGWYFTILSLLLLISRVSIVFVLKYGPKWRLERREREIKLKEQKSSTGNSSINTATNQ